MPASDAGNQKSSVTVNSRVVAASELIEDKSVAIGFHWSVLVENIENLLKHHRWVGIHHQHVEQEQFFSSRENFFSSSGPLYNAT
ncbi:uncharacterized protein N7515_005971 [Penicillium bovifimosum]|uniref:Uncharacterized protein n=1 Tax=Penicillium bovifimosum TaxID=126998 RepID=A0A9W9L0R1_9EURO|nr:uncharacterized protein N7515_005971 [Penicillium bovifimosum]KAJ5129932.1 hypothetical protein N7515_005971 [Penicillium bovifimosum]